MHRRAPTTRDTYEIAVDSLCRSCRGSHLDRAHMGRPARPRERAAGDQPRARGLGRGLNACGNGRARIDDRLDGDAGAGEIGDRACRLVAGAEHDRAPTERHCIPVEIGPRRSGQHDAGAIVVAKHQRPLDRSRGNDASLGEDVPEPLARLVARRHRDVIVDALQRGIGAVIVGADDRGAQQDANVRQRCQLLRDVGGPVRRSAIVEHSVLGE